jgi:glycerol uptake facilitator-like aquaporin
MAGPADSEKIRQRLGVSLSSQSATTPPVPGLLRRRLLAEFIGTGLLVTAVIGSGVAAARLSPHDVGLQLLENAIATSFALGVLILVLAPVSGAHLNPVVTIAHWWLSRHRVGAPSTVGRDAACYIGAQAIGAIAGTVLANTMYALPAASWSTTSRSGPALWLGEIVATAGLVLVIFALIRSGRSNALPAAVGAYIGAAYWFTSSTSFANPAVTIARAFSDTFAGIAPASVPAFIAAQLVGATLGGALVVALYPSVRASRLHGPI